MNFDDTPHPNDFYVSFDKTKLDMSFVIREVRGSYWGGWRSPVVIFKSVDNSICAGLYHHPGDGSPDQQVGFARVVTDDCTFAWICDVLVAKEYQHRGLGKFMMRAVMEHPQVKPRACMLATRDAHEFYKSFGFEPFTAMKRLPNRGE